jgi:hypothetical protein
MSVMPESPLTMKRREAVRVTLQKYERISVCCHDLLPEPPNPCSTAPKRAWEHVLFRWRTELLFLAQQDRLVSLLVTDEE